MRIADSQLYANARTFGGNARSRVVEASNALSSGYRVTGPGDDVTAYGLAQRHQVVAQQSAHFARVTSRAQSEVQAADCALGRVTEELIAARTLAVQMANDTMDTNARQNGALSVQSLRASIVSALNLEIGGTFVFAGTANDAPPFDANGNYAGDDVIRRVEVAPNTFEAISVAPQTAFLGAAGGVNLFTALDDLEAALVADDTAQIRATLDTLTAALNQVSNARAQLGGHANVLDASEAAHVRMQETASIAASVESEQDLILGASNLAQAQNALEATLTAAAKTFELSLLDRLR